MEPAGRLSHDPRSRRAGEGSLEEIVKKLILKATHRIWNQRISALLCRAYERGVIDSYQLHVLAALFDPTQKHEVY